MTCKNCSSAITGNFCSNCGQKGEIHRISLSYIAHEFSHALTHADKGFLLLVKVLVTKPGIVAKEYIEGKRKKYFNPLSFIVLTSAIDAYISFKTGYFAAMDTQGGGGGGGRRMPPIWREVFQISLENGKILNLILIVPLLAFLSWLFFRRPKYSIAEIFVLNSFIVGETHVIRTLIFIPLFLLFPQFVQLNLWVFEFLLLVYLVIAYKQFFGQHIIFTILKSVLIMVFFIVGYWLLILGYVFLKHLIF
jgi:uncharacterized protein DUF3667